MSVITANPFAALRGVEIREHEPMSRHTSFGVGGPTDWLALPEDEAALAPLLRTCVEAGLPYLIVGNGTNLIFRDGGFRGIVIKIAEPMSGISKHGKRLVAQAGAGLDRLCHQAAEAGLAGLTWAAGIPGTVGGAVWMNAGANGGEVGGSVRHVRVLTLAGERLSLERGELDFSYRHSALQGQPLVVTEVEFELADGSPAEIRREMYEVIEQRLTKQPLKERSAGCIFKRPPRDFAGRLIECSGCKGLQVGGAQISPKHAGFIVNVGGATARDVLELVEQVRQRVHDEHGVWLEREVCVVGDD
jgi:UDP-N-acetylmuramate dehydrogenase